MNDVPLELKYRGAHLLRVKLRTPKNSRDVVDLRLAKVVRASVWETGVVRSIMKSTEE